MSEEVKPEVIKKTQEALKKYIKKPPLTEKLLKKPPFRFLHDIVTNIIAETGFLNGLFSSEELNHENIKDRDGKVAFLDKLISAVKIITSIPLSVRATKIVAGHEPTKTNELLQAIGLALDKKLDSKDVAQQLRKKGSKRLEPSGSGSKKVGSRETQKETHKIKPSKHQEENKNVREESTDRKKHSPPSTKLSANNEKDLKTVKAKSKKEGMRHEPKSTRQKDIIEASLTHPEISATQEDTKEVSGQQKRPLSAIGQRRVSLSDPSDERPHDLESLKADHTPITVPSQQEETAELKINIPDKVNSSSVEEPVTQRELNDSKSQSVVTNSSNGTPLAPVPLARPRTAARVGSARPGAPRVRNKGDATVVTEELIRPPTVNLIVDGDNTKIDQEEEEENLVVVETVPVEDLPSAPDPRQSQGSRPASQQGQLVAQILETQKELDVANAGLESDENYPLHTEIEWEAGKRRERESAAKEMERMRALVQTLTRAAHPLGKLLDSLQEDVDNMHRELLQWQSMQASLEQQLKMEESLSAQATQPLKDQLKQLQQAVGTQLDQLSASKASVLNNDSRIHQLLTGGQS